MKSILENIISQSDLGFLPSVGVVVLMATMLLIIAWTYRPGSKKSYEDDAKLVLDEGGRS